MKVQFNTQGVPMYAIGRKFVMKTSMPDETLPSAPSTQELVLDKLKGKNFIMNGDSNDLPDQFCNTIENNGVLTRALNMSVDIAAGNGLIPIRVTGYDDAGKETLEYVNDIELISMLNKNWVYFYIFETLRDRAKIGYGFAQLRPNVAGDKIVKITPANALYTRLVEPVNGIVPSVFYSGKFPDIDETTATEYILLNNVDPEEHLAVLQAEGKLTAPVFYQMKNRFSNRVHYTLPNWYTAKEWVEISNKVPKFINAGMDNIVNITTIIHIPYSYWEKKYPQNQWDGKEKERTQAIQADLDLIEENFTSVENARKTLIAMFGADEGNSTADQWKIEVLQPKSDPESIKSATAADSYITIAAGLNPDVLGLMYGNSKGGSMQRELLLLHEILSTSARNEVLEPLELMIRFNNPGKYDDVQIRFKQDFLTTLDTGKQTGTTLT